jgi:hypothetical protein
MSNRNLLKTKTMSEKSERGRRWMKKVACAISYII